MTMDVILFLYFPINAAYNRFRYDWNADHSYVVQSRKQQWAWVRNLFRESKLIQQTN